MLKNKIWFWQVWVSRLQRDFHSAVITSDQKIHQFLDISNAARRKPIKNTWFIIRIWTTTTLSCTRDLENKWQICAFFEFSRLFWRQWACACLRHTSADLAAPASCFSNSFALGFYHCARQTWLSGVTFAHKCTKEVSGLFQRFQTAISDLEQKLSSPWYCLINTKNAFALLIRI